MGYWTGKCFGCYVVGILSFMTFMTVKEIKYENRKKQIKQKYEKNVISSSVVVDSTSTSTNKI
jgi:hypothetical protein